MTNIYNEISSHLVNEVAANTESLIMHALELHTGLPFKEISTDEIMRLGNIETQPDGVEVVSYDGTPLLEFQPAQIHRAGEHVEVTRKYRRLQS